jgi:hypothetical protein
LAAALAAGCAGTGPSRSLESFREERTLPADARVVLVDLDDTVYECDAEQPMAGAATALRELARDHVIVYLTARPTVAKIPGVTHNRDDSEAFLRANEFPDGPLFTSSLWEWMTYGEGGGKVRSFERLRELGIERVDLAVGDRPHDLHAYLHNGSVDVERAVIILIEDAEHADPDRERLPRGDVPRSIPGTGPAWPRILKAYRAGELDGSPSWMIAQPPS